MPVVAGRYSDKFLLAQARGTWQAMEDARRWVLMVTFPRLVIMLPAGACLFLALTAGVVLLLEIVDQRVKSPADIAMISRTRVLGFVPHAAEDPSSPPKVETVFRDQPGGVLAESFRQLRGVVLKRMQAGGHKSLVCMSGMPGSGSTTIVTNLAFALAAQSLGKKRSL